MSEWIAARGYEGLYEVSSDGEVRSLDRERITTRGLQRWPGKMLSPFLDNNGYLYVNLSNGKRAKKTAVHRIILKSFVGMPRKGLIACHNNGNRTDNRVKNLRWDTYKANHEDMRSHGTHMIGEKSGAAKLSIEQVLEIKESDISSIEAAKIYGVASSTIRAIRLGVNWGEAVREFQKNSPVTAQTVPDHIRTTL